MPDDAGFGTGWVLVTVLDGVVEAPLVAAIGSKLVDCGADVAVDMVDTADFLGGKRALVPTKNSLPRSIARILISLGGQLLCTRTTCVRCLAAASRSSCMFTQVLSCRHKISKTRKIKRHVFVQLTFTLIYEQILHIHISFITIFSLLQQRGPRSLYSHQNHVLKLAL